MPESDVYSIFSNGTVASPAAPQPQQTDQFSIFSGGGVAPIAPAAGNASPSKQDVDDATYLNKLRQTPLTTLVGDDNFDPLSAFQDAKLSADPVVKQKILDVYKTRQQQGITPKSIIDFATGAIKGIASLPAAIGKAAGNIAGQVTNIVSDIRPEDLVSPVPFLNPLTHTGRGVQAATELAAGAESNVANLAALGRRVIEKGQQVFDPTQTDNTEWERRLKEAIDTRNSVQEADAGKGRLSKGLLGGTTLNDIAQTGGTGAVNPENVQTAAPLLDPTLLIPVGAGAKAASAAEHGIVDAGFDAAKAAAGNVADTAAAGLKTTGKVLATAGDKGAVIGPAGGAVIASLAGAPAGGVVGAALGGALLPKAVRAVGRGLQTIGGKLDGTVARGPIWEAASNLIGGELAETAAKGALHGLGAGGDALPAAFTALNLFGAENAEQAGTLLGGQAALGAAGAVGSEAAAKLAPYFDLNNQAYGNREDSGNATAPVVSQPYGASPVLDEAHAAVLATLPQWAQNRINAFREAVRPLGKQIYVLDPAEFGRQVADLREQQAAAAGETLTPDQLTGIAEDANNANGTYLDRFNINGKPTDVIFMKSDDSSLGHEGSHMIEALLDPKARQSIAAAIQKNLTPDELQTFSDRYLALEKNVDPNAVMTPEKLNSEIFAELGGLALNGVPLDTIGMPKPITRAIYQGILGLAHKLKYDTGKTTLGVPKNPFLASMFENVIRSEFANRAPVVQKAAAVDLKNVNIGATPTPARPTIPTVDELKNIRVGKDDQNRFQKNPAAELDEVGKAIDRNKTYGPAQKAAYVKVGAALAQGGNNPRPIEIEYGSVKTPEFAAGRGTRRAEQAEGYLRESLGALPPEVREKVQKVLVPTRFEVRNGDNVQLVGMSLDKVVANAFRVANDAETHGVASEVPYETQQGKLTDTGWKNLVKDIQDYTSNQANGYAGNGKRVTVPKDYAGEIPPENPSYRPTPLADDKANFVNVLMALPPPKTTALKSKTQSGVPANVSARKLAEVNSKEVLPSVTSKEGANFYKDYGVEIGEFNPLRDRLAKAGVDVRDLLEVTERINLENIHSVKVRNDLDFSRPSTDLIRAGFMPDPRKASRAGNQEVRDIADEYTKSAGIEYHPFNGYVKPPEDLSRRIADWYDNAKSSPNDPAVRAAYDALGKETVAQYHAMEAAGYSIEPWSSSGEPYKSSADMVADVKTNKHLWFFLTDNGFGDPSAKLDASTNPLLAPGGVEIDGKQLLLNDVFRAVHDFYGHAKEGYEFGPRGEFNAFLAHSTMFTPEALPALAAETLAQNSWVNFGPHLRDEAGKIPTKGEPGYKPLTERPFADQKVLAVPPDLLQEALSLRDSSGKPAGTAEGSAPRAVAGSADTENPVQAVRTTDIPSRSAAADSLPSESAAPAVESGQLSGQNVRKPAPAELIGTMEGNAKFPSQDLYNLTEDVPGTLEYPSGNVKGSTITAETLKKLGFDVPNLTPEERTTAIEKATIERNKFKEEMAKFFGNATATEITGPAAQFSPALKPQFAIDKPLDDSIGRKVVDVIHYTTKGNLARIDPRFMAPKPNTYQKMYRGENKAFFFVKGSKPLSGENVTAASKPVQYEARLDGGRLYDMDKDPQELWFAINPAKADASLMEQGYAGYRVTTGDGRKFVAVYEPVQVAKVSPEAKFSPVESVSVTGENAPTVKTDVREGRYYKSIAKNLTPEERDGMRKDVAQSIVDLHKDLPKDEDFETAYKLGSIKKGWYERAAKSLQTIFGPDTEKFVGLLAATSPRQSVQENLLMAFRTWNEWDKAGRPESEDSVRGIVKNNVEMEARENNSVRALMGQDLVDNPISATKQLDSKTKLSGFKVESFRRNLLGDLNASTNDSWMAQFSNIDQQKYFGSKSGYLAFNAKVRSVATKLGVEPAHVQETVWSFFKTLVEQTTVKRPAAEVLDNLSEQDIASTPEFHDELLNNPQVREQLERLGFTGFDRLGDPEQAGKVADASELPLKVTALDEQDHSRVLKRIAGRAQAIKDTELKERTKAPNVPLESLASR